jgi:hypothetical protein
MLTMSIEQPQPCSDVAKTVRELRGHLAHSLEEAQ